MTGLCTLHRTKLMHKEKLEVTVEQKDGYS